MIALIYIMDRLSLMNCFQIFGSYLGLAVNLDVEWPDIGSRGDGPVMNDLLDFDIAQRKGCLIKGHGRV